MTRAQKNLLAFLGMIACFLIGLIGWVIYQNYWTRPLGPALNLPTQPASSPTSGRVALSPTLPLTPAGYNYLPTFTPAPTFTPIASFTPSIASCGVSSTMTLLAIGTDSRSDSYLYGLADVIRVVRVDFSQSKIAILEFPRDLWVKIPFIADNLHGQNHEKLNQAYLYGNPGYAYWNDPSAGPGLLARTLDLNFGVHPDHYVAVNLRTFEKIVDTMDGIDIYLPVAVDGRSKDDMRASLFFDKGLHHLDGAQAAQLARIRSIDVFKRADTQNRVLCALRDKLIDPGVLPKIPAIISSFLDNIQTDLSPEQISQLACFGTKLNPAAILFASFPRELFQNSSIYDPVFKANVFIWNVDFSILRDYVTKFNAGTWPVPEPSADTEKSTPFCPPPGQ